MTNEPKIVVRPLNRADLPEWSRLRVALWPTRSLRRHEKEMGDALHSPDKRAVFVSEAGGDRLNGFIEVGVRSSAEGCQTSPVASLEGWYVDARARGAGIGARLVAAAEAWAVEKGCAEIASAADLDNKAARDAHRELGYEEIGRLVHFRKSLHKRA